MNKLTENKIVFYLIITLTCMGFLIGLGAWQDNNIEALVIGVVLTISGFIIIRFFNSIFPNKIPSRHGVKQ